MRFIIIFLLSVSFVSSPLLFVSAEVGSTVTRATPAQFVQLTYQEQLQALLNQLQQLQALLQELTKEEVVTVEDVATTTASTTLPVRIINTSGTIDFRSSLATIRIMLSDGTAENKTIRSTNLDTIASLLGKEFDMTAAEVRPLLRLESLNADELRSVTIRILQNDSIQVRALTFGGESTSRTFSRALIISQALIPVYGTAEVADEKFDEYLQSIKENNGRVPREIYALAGRLLGVRVTASFRSIVRVTY